MYVIGNCRLITQDKIIENGNLFIKDGKIVKIIVGDVEKDYDAGGRYVSAGFIDIHTHGGYGSDFMDATDEAFDNVLKFHLDNGTTSVVATSVTASISSTERFLNFCREYMQKERKYARVLGAHLEGPYLSVKNKGAQKEEYLLNPEKDGYEFILRHKDVVKTVTISPELSGAGEMTKTLTENGITVCGGHDDGIYPNFMPAVENGLKHLTHIYCAMSELRFVDGKRNVGLREYGLLDDNLTAEMIFDERHIPTSLALLLLKAKGADKLCVVSDSLRCAGMPVDGKLYKLGTLDDEDAQLFKVADGVAVLADGTRYAGSITPVQKMVKNLLNAGVLVCEAFKVGTSTPAKILGRADIGRIDKGCVADLCVFENDFSLKDVFTDGKLYALK